MIIPLEDILFLSSVPTLIIFLEHIYKWSISNPDNPESEKSYYRQICTGQPLGAKTTYVLDSWFNSIKINVNRKVTYDWQVDSAILCFLLLVNPPAISLFLILVWVFLNSIPIYMSGFFSLYLGVAIGFTITKLYRTYKNS